MNLAVIHGKQGKFIKESGTKMGMAASQVRLLQLTSRKNTIGYQLQNLSLQKTALSRDMQRVTRNYQEALNTKTLKWSNNSGVSYVDLSYANLMRPSSANQNNPYLITNADGKVVLDSKYQQYAEMISPDGKAGGDWESNRTQILASLTGISAEKIDAASTSSAALDAAADKVNTLQEAVDKSFAKCSNKTKSTDFMIAFGDVSASSYNWDNSATGTINLGNCYEDGSSSENGSYHMALNTTDPVEAKTLMNQLFETFKTNAKDILTDEDYAAFSEACDQTADEYEGYIDAFEAGYYACGDDKSSMLNQYGVEISKRTTGEFPDGKFIVRIANVMENLMRNYESAGGTTSYNSQNSNIVYYTTVDRNSEEYAAYEANKAALEEAKAEYQAAVDTDNQVLTSEEESNINFYEKLFTAIAEKGWVANSQIEDNDYLNNMLQNNQYYITTMEEQTDSDGVSYFEYSQDIASNFENVFSVNDTDAQNEALIDYEYEKSVINEKETRIDTRMQNLETEQSAINEMIKGIETVRNDNTERTFGIFA